MKYNWNRRLVFLAGVVTAVLVLSSPATAALLYTNLANGTSSNPTAIGATAWAAESFSTDSINTLLTKVIVPLEGIPNTGTFKVSLYSNNGGAPGTSLLNVGTGNDSTLSTTFFTNQVYAVNNFALAPNTLYWIVVSGTSITAPDATWKRALDATGIGVAGNSMATSTDSGGTWSTHAFNTDFPPFVMEVDAGASGTPEPASALLFLVGLAGFGLGYRNRTRKA